MKDIKTVVNSVGTDVKNVTKKYGGLVLVGLLGYYLYKKFKD